MKNRFKSLAALAVTASLAMIAPGPANASWKVEDSTYRDGDTPDATSALTAPTRPAAFPHEGIQAKIKVSGCDLVAFAASGGIVLPDGSAQGDLIFIANGSSRSVFQFSQILKNGILFWDPFSDESSLLPLPLVLKYAESLQVLVPLRGGDRIWEFDMTGARAAIEESCPTSR